MSVAPPVYLSEEEAAKLIAEEALSAGVKFETAGDLPSLVSDRLPTTSGSTIKESKKDEYVRSGTLALDGYDSRLGLAFEFVSKDDVVEWRDKNDKITSTVELFDALDTAKRLSEAVSRTAVFYDPMGRSGESVKEYIRESDALMEELVGQPDAVYAERMAELSERWEKRWRAEAEENLRLQVRDFLAWLAGEGII